MFECQNPEHASCSYSIQELRNKAIVRCYHDCWIAQIPPKRERERLAKIATAEARERTAILCEIADSDWKREVEEQNRVDQVDQFGDSNPR